MSKAGVRIKKSRSMMFSLYSLSGLAAILILSFVGTLWMRTATFLPGINWKGIEQLVLNSLWIQTAAVLIAVPVASALTFLVTYWSNSQWSSGFRLTLDLIEGAPTMVFGVGFLALLGGNVWAVVLTFAVIACTELTKRWLYVTRSVSTLEIEAMMSLGCSMPKIVSILFIKRFLVLFMGHLMAVFCQLFVLVTPVLCFLPVLPEENSFTSLLLFHFVRGEVSSAAGLAFLVLLAHLVKVALDQRTSFWEAQYG